MFNHTASPFCYKYEDPPVTALSVGLSPAQISALMLTDPAAQPDLHLRDTKHRLDLISKCGIPLGAKVLEIGCGRGEFTAVLADVVGPTGHVTGIDFGLVDEGTPITPHQSRTHLSSTILGPRITWTTTTPSPLTFLATPPTKYDIAVLAHSAWHTPNLYETLAALSSLTSRLCIAEWSLSSSSGAGLPHILAVLAQAVIAPRNTSVVSPIGIKQMAREGGWMLETEAFVTPHEELRDARREVEALGSERFRTDLEGVGDEKRVGAVRALVDAARMGLREGGDVPCMDVWCGVFRIGEE
ncbi:hypothetical protein BDK51DRAFT_23609 [Blyttiomyces helicus]|uniref:S-adenosyl-L-methionine-dependent methyltransferase n=1 Tax=Blyttiomyces helicus TaxID=388810 RepID=A0A4P9VY91_9FUNG|nr:hypothetical protein BDK51DRAFT_23609 [Blyttiomyces helicus]|eukprot:RKO83280.1 hypothetical protein BDK51DRAFT_23609 [Blyttiomyces helicus]